MRAPLSLAVLLLCSPAWPQAAMRPSLPHAAPAPALAPGGLASLGTLPLELPTPRLAPVLDLGAVTPSLLPSPPVLAAALPPAAPPSLEGLRTLESSLPRGRDANPGPAIDSFWNASRRMDGEVSLLDAPRAHDRAILGGIEAAARASPTGRRALESISRLVAATGKPIQVRLRDLGRNLGEYDYIHRVLFIDRALASRDPRQAAATLIHELVHVRQHADGVPAEALEMELEAHVLTLQAMEELDLRPAPNSFSAAAARQLARSPGAFESWLARQLPSKLRLTGGFGAARAALLDEAEILSDDIAALEDSGAESPQARGRLASARERLAAVKRDLARLRSPSGRQAYRRLAVRARTAMRRYHQRLSRNAP